MRNKQDIICDAVRAISDEWTLKQLAKFIYNITNAKQNGHSADEKAAEIVENIMKKKDSTV